MAKKEYFSPMSNAIIQCIEFIEQQYLFLNDEHVTFGDKKYSKTEFKVMLCLELFISEHNEEGFNEIIEMMKSKGEFFYQKISELKEKNKS